MKEFQWHAPEYPYKPKEDDWYWTVGIITAALVVIAVIFGDTLFGVVIAVGVFTLTMFASREPKTISVEVNEKGVTIDKVLYPFLSLDSFSVDDRHHRGPRLHLKSKKMLMPLVTVPIGSDASELRAFLATHLKEEAFEESLMQMILDRIGF